MLPVVSAVLITLSFPKFDLGFLAWFGLAPLFFVLRKTRLSLALFSSFLFGGLYCIGAFSWLYAISSINLSNFLVMFIIFCAYFLVYGLFYRLISNYSGLWLIFFAPALWVAMEYIRSNIFFLSLPWNLIGHSQYRYSPVIQIADITGVYGISFVIVMVNQLLSHIPELLCERLRTDIDTEYSCDINWFANLVTASAFIIFTLSYGWYRLAIPEGSNHLRIAIVQPNVLAKNGMSINEQMEHMKVYERLTEEAALKRPRFIIWPSSSLPAPIDYSRLIQYTLIKLAHETGAYLLVGGAGGEKFGPRDNATLPYSNSEFLISPAGRLEGQYNKMRLLPFNEYLPLRGIMRWPSWITKLQADFVAGDKYTLFQIGNVKFGTPICWENMLPDHFRRFVKNGANFMVSVTNEGFFGHSDAPYQTLSLNVFRAVENRVAIARANTTGVSAVISPRGGIVERVRDSSGKDLFVSGVIVRDVPISDQKTFYTVYGDIFAYVVSGMAVLIILTALYRRRRVLSGLRRTD